jgi:hypothetical protein
MSVSFRRIAGALALAVFFLRVLAPEVGHACDSMESRHSTTAMAASESPSATHHAIDRGDVASTGTSDHGANHGQHAAAEVPGHVHHVQEAVATSGGEEPVSPGHHDVPCDCSDWCCCVPTLTSPPLPVVATVTVTLAEASAPTTWTAAATPVAGVERLLPFATAPPRT